MAGANQLLPGFNHNVKHQGKLYHVQTEDSGTANPHVTTHLFLGGNILSSRKTSYAELVAAGDDLVARRKLMEAQHKEMLRQLVRGAFDAVEAERTARARAFAPGELHAAGRASSVVSVARPANEAAPVADGLAPAANEPAPPGDVAPEPLAAAAPQAASGARAGPQRPGGAVPADGWGPPVLPRAPRPPPPRPAPAAPQARRLDELVLSYLAGAGDPTRSR